MNRRKQIRNYVIQTLKKNLPDISVQSFKKNPLEESTQRAIQVLIQREESNVFARSPLELEKKTELCIEFVISDMRSDAMPFESQEGNASDSGVARVARIARIEELHQGVQSLEGSQTPYGQDMTGDDCLEDSMDTLTAKVEEIFYLDEDLHNLINQFILKETEIHSVKDGDQQTVLARMIYEITYFSSIEKRLETECFTGARVHLL